MPQFKIYTVLLLVIILAYLTGCKEDIEPTGKGMYYLMRCSSNEGIVYSIKADCSIEFWDYMHNYTYTGIESSFYTLNAPCNESLFSVKYINSVHDHNEPDYTFVLKMDPLMKNEFFKPGSYRINDLMIIEEKLTGSGGAPYFDVDITLVWEEVALNGVIYSGKGKIVIHKDIPHSSFPNYKYPAQEIPFEFPARSRTMH